MAWARLDDRFHEHWKVAEAGLEAVGLWTLCLTWAQQARRTSPAPGVVPESVIARFAGSPGKAKRLTARLHSVGMLDNRTAAGWPIHDFEHYLPKYDSHQASENGRKGGRPKAKANQTAFDPPPEPEANPNPEESPRADAGGSARRNPVPVPVPTEPKGSGRQRPLHSVPPGEEPGSSAQRLVGFYVDKHTDPPPSQVRAHIGRQIKALLAEGYDPEQLEPALTHMARKGLHPSTLPSVVNQLANRPAPDPDRRLSGDEVTALIGPDSWTCPTPPAGLTADEEWEWRRDQQIAHIADRQAQARDRQRVDA